MQDISQQQMYIYIVASCYFLRSCSQFTQQNCTIPLAIFNESHSNSGQIIHLNGLPYLHLSWQKIPALPKGLFLRIWRNCSNLDVFRNQSAVIKQHFVDKGYPARSLDEVIQQVTSLNRGYLLVSKMRVENNTGYELVYFYHLFQSV